MCQNDSAFDVFVSTTHSLSIEQKQLKKDLSHKQDRDTCLWDNFILDKTLAMLRFVGTSSESSRFREASRKLAPAAVPPLPIKAAALMGALGLTIHKVFAADAASPDTILPRENSKPSY